MPLDVEKLVLDLTHCSLRPVHQLEDITCQPVRQPASAAVIENLDPSLSKPLGFWVAHKDEWLDTALMWAPQLKRLRFGAASMKPAGFFMYRVRLPMDALTLWSGGKQFGKPDYKACESGKFRNTVLVLLTREEAMAFHRRYRKEHVPHYSKKERLDWQAVADHFAGVYVWNPNPSPGDPLWYQMWDLPSACIWRPSQLQLTLHELPAGEVAGRVHRLKCLQIAAG